MNVTADEFARAVRGLPLTDAQAAAVSEVLAAPGARDVPGELVRRAVLTDYQVRTIQAGRAADLTVGRYVLLDELGRGGMGAVYKARDTAMDRVVALKLIRADRLASPGAYSRFQQEIRAVARLAHPNIVRAYDAGTAAGKHFLVTELVTGHDLARELARRGAFPPGEACDYVRQAAVGLQHAHEKGLVHRDIKPANLLFSTTEKLVKIADFGLARLGESGAASGLTADGAVMGTPDYIAPEQALAAAKADIRSDLYSLGCTLYHFLTGHPPFPAETITGKPVAHASHAPAPLEDACPGLSPALIAVVNKLMAKDPGERYQTPGEAAEALIPFCRNQRTTADLAPAASVAKSAPSIAPRPAPASPSKSAGSVSTLGAGAHTAAPTPPAPEPLTLDPEPQPAPPPRAEPQQNLCPPRPAWRGLLAAVGGLGGLAALVAVVAPLLNRKPEVVVNNDIKQTANVTVPPVNVTVKLDDWPKAREPGVVIIIGDRPVTLDELTKPLALPPGRHVVVLKKDGKDIDARGFDVPTGRGDVAVIPWVPDPVAPAGEVQSWGPGGVVTELIYHPDGKRFSAIFAGPDPFLNRRELVFGCGHLTYEVGTAAHPIASGDVGCDVIRVALVNPELGLSVTYPQGAATTSVRYITLFVAGGYGSTMTHRPLPDNHYAHLTVASADGTWVLWSLTNFVSGHPTGDIRLESIKIENKWTVTLKEQQKFTGTTACFDPTGRHVFVADKTSLTRYDGADGKPVAAYPGATDPLTVVAAPDAGRVAAGDAKGNVYIWDVANKNPSATAKGHTGRVSAIVFTPDGKRMITASWDRTVRVWDAATGKELHQLAHDGAVYALAMSPGGRRVISSGADKTIKLWQLPE